MTAKETERQQAIRELRKLVKPGDTLHTILRHVSRSGMSRRIDVVKMGRNGPRYLTWLAAKVLGERTTGNGDGLVVGGCGMDMGFHVVYSLSRALYPKGFKVSGVGRNGDKSGWDNDGGYALKQEWL